MLCVGAPNVARLLEDRGVDVTLVDRQPFQNVRRHLALEICDFEPDRTYRAALVDPPWYQVFLRHWTRAAARAVGANGTVLVSVLAWKQRGPEQAWNSTRCSPRLLNGVRWNAM